MATRLGKLQSHLGSSSSTTVVDLSSRDMLFSSRPQLALAPASNEKLFTTSAALLRFGPAGTLVTSVYSGSSGAIDPQGVLNGDLYLVGGGDPTLGSGGLETLAGRLRDAGLKRITGGVRGDESAFDTLRGGPDSGFGYDSELGGALTALSWAHGSARHGSPALAAAARFAAALKHDHITYALAPHTGTYASSKATAGGASSAAQPLATVSSAPMSTLVAETNLPSENFYAEMLAKALGARFGTSGSTQAGLEVVSKALSNLADQPHLVDGSGLSRADRTSSQTIAELLLAMDRSQVAKPFRASLPVAGLSGTLARRMRGTAAAGRCQAKTGTLIGVSALSGYCVTTGGRQVVFSMIENNISTYTAKKLEDRAVATIARLTN